jgi:hypothetical protein
VSKRNHSIPSRQGRRHLNRHFVAVPLGESLGQQESRRRHGIEPNLFDITRNHGLVCRNDNRASGPTTTIRHSKTFTDANTGDLNRVPCLVPRQFNARGRCGERRVGEVEVRH